MRKLFNYILFSGTCISIALIFFLTSSAHAETYLYVPNEADDTVSVINGKTYITVDTITVGDEPYGVAVSPDSKTVFITNLKGNSVSVIDAGTNTVIETIPVGTTPFGIAVAPDGRYAFVANGDDDTVSVINTETLAVETSVSVGDNPHGLAIHPDGTKMYVTNYFSSNVTVLYTTYPWKKTISVGAGPHGIAMHPEGTYVYVANVFDNTLSVIRTSTETVIKVIPTGNLPFFPAVDPTGKFLYVSNWDDRTVTGVDLSNHSAAGTILVGSHPHGIAFDPLGSKAYVANEVAGTLSVIDTTTHKITATVFLGNQPVAFGNFVRNTSGSFYPTGQDTYEYDSTKLPIIGDNPSASEPWAVGSVSYGKSTLSLKLGLPEFPEPVDIYLGIEAPALYPDIYLVTPGRNLKPLSEGLIPYKSNTTGPADEAVFGDIDMATLPPTKYNLYVMITPTGSLKNYVLWTTEFYGQYDMFDTADKLIDSFGDAAFGAFMYALDNGYSLRQTVDAVMSDRLQANGDIQSSAGGIEPPVHPSYGLILRSNMQAGLSSPHDGPYTLEEVRDHSSMLGDQIPAFAAHGHRVGSAILMDMLFAEENAYDSRTETEWDDAMHSIMVTQSVTHDTTPEGGVHNVRRFTSNGTPIPPPSNAPETGVIAGTQGQPCIDNDHDAYGVNAVCGAFLESAGCDNDASRNPGTIEICDDGIDNDCDGAIDELGACSPPTCPEGQELCGTACFEGGGDCCGPGLFCEPGWHCVPGKCCPGGMLLCPDGIWCYIPGVQECP